MKVVDWSQISIGNIVAGLYRERKSVNNANGIALMRHMIINSIVSLNKQHTKYGELVIVCDSRNYWRRDVFPYYKANRKKARDKSDLDWNFIHDTCNQIKQEVIDHLPYKVIEVDGAEADDCMAVLAKACATDERFAHRDGLFESPQPCLVVSNDSDMHQLRALPNVDIYEPRTKKFINISREQVEIDLKTKIISGDTGDGIPGIKSGDNFLAEGIRQIPVRKPFIEQCINDLQSQPDDIQRNYRRNEQLISFEFIPQTISDKVIDAYFETIPKGNRSTVAKYLMANQMVQLLDRIGDF